MPFHPSFQIDTHKMGGERERERRVFEAEGQHVTKGTWKWEIR